MLLDLVQYKIEAGADVCTVEDKHAGAPHPMCHALPVSGRECPDQPGRSGRSTLHVSTPVLGTGVLNWRTHMLMLTRQVAVRYPHQVAY